MSKGGGATTTPAATPQVPQTNALKHLLEMLGPETFGQKKDDAGNPGGQMPTNSTPLSSSMPVINPQAWMQQGAGNFTPSGGITGGKGGQTGSPMGGSPGKGGGG